MVEKILRLKEYEIFEELIIEKFLEVILFVGVVFIFFDIVIFYCVGDLCK